MRLCQSATSRPAAPSTPDARKPGAPHSGRPAADAALPLADRTTGIKPPGRTTVGAAATTYDYPADLLQLQQDLKADGWTVVACG